MKNRQKNQTTKSLSSLLFVALAASAVGVAGFSATGCSEGVGFSLGPDTIGHDPNLDDSDQRNPDGNVVSADLGFLGIEPAAR